MNIKEVTQGEELIVIKKARCHTMFQTILSKLQQEEQQLIRVVQYTQMNEIVVYGNGFSVVVTHDKDKYNVRVNISRYEQDRIFIDLKRIDEDTIAGTLGQTLCYISHMVAA